ncbi:MAG: hypothetical protein GWN25_44020, partial [Actinobacteria bacterium]|nr:hypothetical protein [Actinomycetota bacterium]
PGDPPDPPDPGVDPIPEPPTLTPFALDVDEDDLPGGSDTTPEPTSVTATVTAAAGDAAVDSVTFAPTAEATLEGMGLTSGGTAIDVSVSSD